MVALTSVKIFGYAVGVIVDSRLNSIIDRPRLNKTGQAHNTRGLMMQASHKTRYTFKIAAG
jgi:hypothetical protein